MKIEFVAEATAPIVSAFAFDGPALTGAAKALDAAAKGALAKAAKAARFTGASGAVCDVLAPAGVSADRVLILGLGKEKSFEVLNIQKAAATAVKATLTSGADTLAVCVGDLSTKGTETAELAAHAAFGAVLAGYRFDKYRTTLKADKKPSLKTVQIVCADPKAAKKAWAPLLAVADAILFARDLVSEPANVLHPEEFARRAKALESLGLEVEILGEKEMKKLGFGALLGVGQGSARDSQLVIMKWMGAKDKSAQPIAFVGKGVTFDTGGISLKPGDGMWDMKWDMGGAGTVCGLMHALAGRKAKVNAIGILGLVENMPDGDAQRPGDVVTSYSGQTIEVLNTDAEGRLVLADALWYCQKHYKPQFIINLATLTGAIIISLGHDVAGVFSNNDKLADRIAGAGKAVGEDTWRMPLPEHYDKLIDSPIADMKNIGPGRVAGSVLAGLFLQRFVNGTPWAHIDIAGVVWKDKSDDPMVPGGAVGFGVKMLDRLVADHYER
jgi:leucyl aminopeptidase